MLDAEPGRQSVIPKYQTWQGSRLSVPDRPAAAGPCVRSHGSELAWETAVPGRWVLRAEQASARRPPGGLGAFQTTCLSSEQAHMQPLGSPSLRSGRQTVGEPGRPQCWGAGNTPFPQKPSPYPLPMRPTPPFLH